MLDSGPDIIVDGIVAKRDYEPYLRLFQHGHQIAQLSMAEARTIAHDILTMAARTEADAIILQFFNKQDYPEAAGVALMLEFRKFRMALDSEHVQHFTVDLDTGQTRPAE